jgi:fermentation-respiration switch protein FrsA (DUF1100 family)
VSLALQTAAVKLFANEPTPPDLEGLAGRIAPTPVFLIYATHGSGGEELSRSFYDAAHEPKTLWEIGEGGHVGGIDALPREYERRVVGFFDDALLASP